MALHDVNMDLGKEPDINLTNFLLQVDSDFKKMNSLRFKDFLQTASKFNLSEIFFGWYKTRFLNTFVQDLLDACSQIFDKASSPQSNYSSLYLLYFCYFAQPVRPRFPIRLTESRFSKVSNIFKLSKEYGHWDAVHILCQLHKHEAFMIVGYPSVVFPEANSRLSFKALQQLNVLEPSSIKKIYNPRKLDELANIQQKYDLAKQEIKSLVPNGINLVGNVNQAVNKLISQIDLKSKHDADSDTSFSSPDASDDNSSDYTVDDS